jgi:hypothetical protein
MIYGVLGYLLLAAITAAYVWLTRWAFRRSQDITLPVAAGILYFWTCAGAWPFMVDALTGYHGFRIGMAYYYLMEKMFPFELDINYLKALALHSSFLAGVMLAWWLFLRKQHFTSTPLQALPIDHRSLWYMGAALCLLSIGLVLPDVTTAMKNNSSIYVAVSASSGFRSTLRGLASQYGTFCLVVGYALNRTGHPADPVLERWASGWVVRAYPVAVLVNGIFLALIGDRHPLFISAMVGALLVLRSYGRSALRRVLPVLVITGLAIAVGGWVRSYSWQEVVTLEKHETPMPDPYPYDLSIIAHVPQDKGPLAHALEPIWTNELFAAHMSMYGVLRKDVPLAPGMSFNYLAHAFIPSALAERPPTVYDHYADKAGLMPGQGYTIHHGTAWYLNVGVSGPLLGGLVLGSLLMGLYRWASGTTATGSWRTLLAVLPVFFVAYLPQVMRSGPEAYKSLLVEGIVLPLLLFAMASWRSLPFIGPRHNRS